MAGIPFGVPIVTAAQVFSNAAVTPFFRHIAELYVYQLYKHLPKTGNEVYELIKKDSKVIVERTGRV